MAFSLVFDSRRVPHIIIVLSGALGEGGEAPMMQRLSDRALQGGVREPRFGIVVAHGKEPPIYSRVRLIFDYIRGPRPQKRIGEVVAGGLMLWRRFHKLLSYQTTKPTINSRRPTSSSSELFHIPGLQRRSREATTRPGMWCEPLNPESSLIFDLMILQRPSSPN